MSSEDSEVTQAEISELEMLDTRISKLIEILPDVLHDKPDTEDQCRAALSHMLSKLLECADATVPVRYPRLTRLDRNAFKTDGVPIA